MLLAITRAVSPALDQCELTHLPRQPIDLGLATKQHQEYERCLASLGCILHRLPPAPELPDSVFVEDTCIILPELGVITRPGAESRRGETAAVAEVMRRYRLLRFIDPPGTLDGGDVLCLGRSVFVGRSSRTNDAGIEQLRVLLAPPGYAVTAVPFTGCLHLKTAVTPVGTRTLLVNRSWVDPGIFGDVATIDVLPSEPFAANALLLGDTVVYAAGYPKTRERLEKLGLRIRVVDVSELGKAEGGVTCGSLIVEVPEGRSTPEAPGALS